jgi:enoyl-CoA hydratase/carnithine racemase
MPKPIIASVNGVAAGGGANLALSCDFVFISERTSFIQSFINLNIIPDTGGLWTLSKRVGLNKAKMLAMTGDVVRAQEAFEMGLADKVLPEADLDVVTMDFARLLASKPPAALAEIKRLSNMIPDMSRAAFIEVEAQILSNLFSQQETLDRITAFVNKKK